MILNILVPGFYSEVWFLVLKLSAFLCAWCLLLIMETNSFLDSLEYF